VPASACIIEALVPRHLRDVVQLILTGLSLLGALVVLWLTWGPGQRRVGAMGAVSVDGPTQIIWLLILIFALLSALLFAERKAGWWSDELHPDGGCACRTRRWNAMRQGRGSSTPRYSRSCFSQ